jgi:hypothetical protein
MPSRCLGCRLVSSVPQSFGTPRSSVHAKVSRSGNVRGGSRPQELKRSGWDDEAGSSQLNGIQNGNQEEESLEERRGAKNPGKLGLEKSGTPESLDAGRGLIWLVSSGLSHR